jgi:thiol-disulfide isomerase/thioredoxin
LLIKDVVEGYKGRVRFVNENWGDSKLAERYGLKRYPVVFVDEALVARPEDFGGWGANSGKYHPWKSPASHEKFKKDLARMIDLTLRGGGGAAKAVSKTNPAKTETIVEITSLPTLALQDVEGQRVESANLTGKAVIVEFWATWCAPCRSTLGWLGQVKQRFGDQVEVITVTVESEEPEVRKLIQSLTPPPRVVLGTDAVAASFGTITSVPTMFVFDRQGRTASIFYGAPEDLHQKAERLLNSLLK